MLEGTWSTGVPLSSQRLGYSLMYVRDRYAYCLLRATLYPGTIHVQALYARACKASGTGTPLFLVRDWLHRDNWEKDTFQCGWRSTEMTRLAERPALHLMPHGPGPH
eukprot:scaffold1219_cov400-Prasinococcus_capsulatus_cf.AAC.25